MTGAVAHVSDTLAGKLAGDKGRDIDRATPGFGLIAFVIEFKEYQRS